MLVFFKCPTCCKNRTSDLAANVSGIGRVCVLCRDELNAPTTLEGCVNGPSIEELGRKIEDEFDRRRDSLLRAARIICGGET